MPVPRVAAIHGRGGLGRWPQTTVTPALWRLGQQVEAEVCRS